MNGFAGRCVWPPISQQAMCYVLPPPPELAVAVAIAIAIAITARPRSCGWIGHKPGSGLSGIAGL
jgi:hypothetical protein